MAKNALAGRLSCDLHVTRSPDNIPRNGVQESRRAEMHLDHDAMKPVIDRIRRAEGQLSGVARMLEEGRECEDVVAQLAAVSKALDRAGFVLVTSGLQQCIATDGGDGLETKKMERLFLSLA
jgi:DNA-binding FrmR family transcriptional regulator